MQVCIKANCWDGMRSKSLFENRMTIVEAPEAVKERFADKLIRGMKRLNEPKVRAIIGFAVPIMLLASGIPSLGLIHAFAASPDAIPALSDGVKTKILHAFDPLINLIQNLSYPIAGVMIAGGCLFIMVGNRERGMQMLQNAAIGYILVQLTPLFLELLVGIGSGI